MSADTEVLLGCESHKKAPPYVEALKSAGIDGGRIRVLVPDDRPDDPAGAAARAAGVVMAGGPDLHPSHYGEAPLAEAGLGIHLALDALDLELLTGARHGRTPVWAICRGMQVANVFLGGSLWQDLQLQLAGVGEHNHASPLDHLAHELERLAAESAFGARLAGDGGAPRVNSRHHQAVKALAPGLRAVAWTPDGVMEALEAKDDWWLRGVQWHPEDLLALPLQRALWSDFAAACARPRVAAAAAPTTAGGTR